MKDITVSKELPADCKKPGLSALAGDKSYVAFGETRDILGSYDIDKCFKAAQPNASRWDYLVLYKGQSIFIEVHGDKASDVIKKALWLHQYIFKNYQHPPIFGNLIYWICTNGVRETLPSSQEGKQLATLKVKKSGAREF
jgi:hypothetical protein